MSDFVAGFAARHQAAAAALAEAFAPKPKGFSPADPSKPARPKSFAPADPDANPTEGWDPFDANQVSAPQPFVDPIAAAHAAGMAEGRAAAEADALRDTALLEQVGQAFGSRIDRETLARQLRQTVLFLVGKIVGETGVAPDILATRITAATDMLADAAESALLRVHPDDVALLDGRLPTTVFAVGDENIQRGGFVLEAASTIIEDGPDLWLDQLAAAIERIAVPN